MEDELRINDYRHFKNYLLIEEIDPDVFYTDDYRYYQEGRFAGKTYNHEIDYSTPYEYFADLDAWCPSIRSRSAIRSGKKLNPIDPSIAVAALGVEPSYFYQDFQTLGFLFESLCIQDLPVYSRAIGGSLSYYHDRFGLEVDGVLHLADGRYALIEFKLGSSEIDEGAKHLCEVERLINEAPKGGIQLRSPELKIILTGTEYGYRRKDGAYVIPIGRLKD